MDNQSCEAVQGVPPPSPGLTPAPATQRSARRMSRMRTEDSGLHRSERARARAGRAGRVWSQQSVPGQLLR